MLSIDNIPMDAQTEIYRRLDLAREEHGARVLMAVESGSRAWGFPSPDSDFDARFVYVLPLESYVSLMSPRDVIEQPIEGLYDLNGWDLRKALNLLLKPNPVLIEWLRSPIVYAEADGFRKRLTSLTEHVDERPAAMHHHSNLMQANYKRFIEDKAEVKLKRYFYSLRPAYALHWMWQNPKGPLPMSFDDLRQGVDEPASRRILLDDLLARKSETRELGMGAPIPRLDAFIEATTAEANSRKVERGIAPSTELTRAAEALFRREVGL